MADPFRDAKTQMADPASEFYAISTSDTVDETTPFRALYVGVAGDVAIVPRDGGTAVVFTGVPAGTVLPVRGVRVDSTNTTATDMVGLV